MLKVIQWATGKVGAHSVAAVYEHPELELVGAYVYSKEKAGKDVGALCGIGNIGVIATSDKAEILAMEADCVLYMAQGEMNPYGALDDICDLLESGKSVVSTAVTTLIFPLSMDQDVVDRLEASCAKGNSAIHATGIEPGWAAEILPLSISPLFRKVKSILVQEVVDYSTYNQKDILFEFMGFGKPEGTLCIMDDPEVMEPTFMASLMLVAKGLGAEIDSYKFRREVAVTDTAFEIDAGPIPANTVAAMRFSLTAIINGREALTLEHITRVKDDIAPHWPTGRGWKVTVDGLPSMVLEATIATNGEDEVDQACLGTAMHAIHAVNPVCAAGPGIKTFLDLPIITGRRIFD